MTFIRRVAGVAAVPAALTLTLVAAAPPASAGLPLLARATVSITHDDLTFEVCAVGSVDDGSSSGLWVFQVTGHRSDGTRIQTLTTVNSATYNEPCYLIQKNRTVGGAFTATLSYVFSVTTADDAELAMGDIVASAGGEGTWNPNNANTFGM